MPTTTPTRARPGTGARVRAATQRNGMIARRLMAGCWEGLRARETVYRLGRVGALTAVNNFPAVRNGGWHDGITSTIGIITD
jgi:hypothetical protein